ncbi:MAG: ABC transporter permease [Gammaproteobacteria bacterium]|nr:ABC transporter permease [Gammaproteobacteria bacterium]
MTLAMLRAAFLLLIRDRGAVVMSLFVPVVFFLIFAEIFATAAGDQLQLRVVIVDEVQDADSSRLLAALRAAEVIRPVTGATDRETARDLVRRGTADVGLVIRADGERLADAAGLAAPPLLLLVDPSRAVTATMLAGQLQQAYFTALPDLAVGRVSELLGTEFTSFSPEQETGIEAGLARLRAGDGPGVAWSFADLLDREDVAGQNAGRNNVAYYAGAVAFMFLLFAAAQGALGVLDDQEAGILDRIAAGPGGITVVLNGRFIYLVLQGLVQTGIIFGVAWVVYGVDLPGNLGAWLMISAASAVLAAGLGLALITGCRSRAQAQILPTVVILIMSAIGGSMVPRFFMPEWLQRLGWLTPNTWALEAYSGIFWRSEPALGLLPICVGLAGGGLAALGLSHWFALRFMRDT